MRGRGERGESGGEWMQIGRDLEKSKLQEVVPPSSVPACLLCSCMCLVLWDCGLGVGSPH